MSRCLLALIAALALGATGCSPKCGPSTCTGCCDTQGVCQAPSIDHCGQNGAACSTCVGFQQCLVGTCQLPGGGAATTSSGGAGSASGTGASTASSSGASASGSTAAASSAGGASSSGAVTGSSGGSTATSAASTAAGSTAAGSTGTSSSSAASSTGAATSSAASSSAAGSSGTSSSASSSAAAASSSGSGTTGGSSSGSGSSGGTTSGLLPICASCSSSASCESGYCDTTTHTCNSAFACVAADCAPYACGANGNCQCGAGTTGGSSSGGTSGGSRPICAPCSQNTDCASQYCNVFGGFCDSFQACTGNAVCAPFTCDTLTGSCLCSGGTTGGGTSGGTTGGSSGGTTGGAIDQCGISRPVIGCSGQTCPAGYTCSSGTCVLNGSSGPLQVTLRWSTNDDVDLRVIEPNGCLVYYGNRTACSGDLDLDSNAACNASPTSEENVVYSSTPPSGTYQVKADLWESCASADPVLYEVVVRKGSSETVTCGTFHPSDASHGGADAGYPVTSFTYP